jgi:hypothetical protein
VENTIDKDAYVCIRNSEKLAISYECTPDDLKNVPTKI